MVRSRCPVFKLDIYRDPGALANAHERYLELNATAPPIFWTPENGGLWIVNDSKLIQKVMRHPEAFSNRYNQIPKRLDEPIMIPESLDPPVHQPYRQLLKPLFEAEAVDAMAGPIATCAESLIDAVADQGECELVEQVSSRYPVIVFGEMLGLDASGADEFRDLVDSRFRLGGDEAAGPVTERILEILEKLIADRQANPRADIVSQLTQANFEDRKLNNDELLSIAYLMFLAGLDTVATAIGFGMKHLADAPELQQRVIDRPEDIPKLVEELLRRYAFSNVVRTVVNDVDLGNSRLTAGDLVVCPVALVGWDENLNQDPLSVSIDRRVFRHATFGTGIHTCLGQHLARLELTTFYRVWFSKIGKFAMVEDRRSSRARGGTVWALEELWLEWNRQ
jgi:cytochrome P450